jgi:DNA repair photolyase
VNRGLLELRPEGRTRIRFSVMPAGVSRLLDIRTSPVDERIAALDDFVEAGYEVQLNFSPIVVYDGWLADWAELLDQIDQGTSAATKQQLACEIIFLTHNESLHEVNLGWHPKAEELIWQPGLQEAKRSENGATNVRYRWQAKQTYLTQFRQLLERKLPYCTVRYAF